MVIKTPEEVLDFWLGTLTPEGFAQEGKAELWFVKSKENDDRIRENFLETLEAARKGELDSWKETPRGHIALVIVHDQFSRNIFRDTPGAFASDPQALALSLEAIEKGVDKELAFAERVFMYMPLMHAEDLETQNKCIEMFRTMQQEAPKEVKPRFDLNVKYAISHMEVIETYGRFPHRNKILGRENAPEEEEYLSDPNAGF